MRHDGEMDADSAGADLWRKWIAEKDFDILQRSGRGSAGVSSAPSSDRLEKRQFQVILIRLELHFTAAAAGGPDVGLIGAESRSTATR